MFASIFKLFLILQSVSWCCNGSSINAPQLKVSVFYESLCPDSVRFIGDQLAPNYSQLRDYIILDFIPFGKAYSVNGGQSFVCQHGPPECYGNMVQSCALNTLPKQEEQMNFVACQMKRGAEPTGRQCMTEINHYGYDDVVHCMNGPLGTQLQLKAEQETMKYGNPLLKFVPTIVYNDKFNQILQDRSQTEFVKVVCELLNNQPEICQRTDIEDAPAFPIYVYNFFKSVF